MEALGKNLLSLTQNAKRRFLESFDYVCLGCDGVIWAYFEDYPDVGQVINRLEGCGKKIIYISNNSLRTDTDYIEKLNKIGVTATADQIIHPIKTITQYCTSHLKNEPIFTLCSEIVNEQLAAKLTLIYPKHEDLETKTDIIEKTAPTEDAAAVLIDTNFNLQFSHLATALQYLQMNKECRLLVGSTDKLLPLRRNVNVLGLGGFVTTLKICSGKEPIVLGKPGQYLRCMLVEQFKMGKTARTLLIGDNLKTDIRFGNECGFQTLLVLSGVTKMEDMIKSGRMKPNFWLNSLDELNEFFDDL